MKYIFVLDFMESKVYRYNLIDAEVHEDFENFIAEQGHSLSNCEWMTTNNGKTHTYMDTD
jgi:hypothetical protein